MLAVRCVPPPTPDGPARTGTGTAWFAPEAIHGLGLASVRFFAGAASGFRQRLRTRALCGLRVSLRHDSQPGAAIRIEPVAGTELRKDAALLVIPATGTSIDDTLVRELIDADRHGR